VQKTKYEGIYKKQEGILLNMDNQALAAYKARKEKDRKAAKTEEDLAMLKDEMREIKELLMKALSNGNS
jgi:hypothetical protein